MIYVAEFKSTSHGIPEFYYQILKYYSGKLLLWLSFALCKFSHCLKTFKVVQTDLSTQRLFCSLSTKIEEYLSKAYIFIQYILLQCQQHDIAPFFLHLSSSVTSRQALNLLNYSLLFNLIKAKFCIKIAFVGL